MNPTSDVLIVGGGAIGLAIAIELKLRGASVTLLSREFSQAASHAAAGMLAAHAEDLPAGAMLDLCLHSQRLYPEWISKLEALGGSPIGYWPCGILAPAYAEIEQPAPTPQRLWLNQAAIHQAQPGLSPDVIGGWWFPEDGQVDNRALTQTLRSIAQSLGVNLQEGVAVTAVQQQQGQVMALKTNTGDWQADQYILATGAWSQAVLPVPVCPRKGQMLSVRMADDRQPLLQRVLYGEEVYLVPRQSGQLLIGATVEDVGFTPHNTPGGLQRLLQAAIRLYPSLQDLPIAECWWGFRPATPDELPILGKSHCQNLTLAIGHYRNGILLAPITARLIADWVWHQQADPLLDHFSWERFLSSPPSAARSIAACNRSALHAHPTPNPPQMLQYSSPSNRSLPDSSLQDNSLQDNSLQNRLQLSSPDDAPLVIAGRSFHSRLMTGTGKYRTFDQMRQSIAASGSQIVTVAVRRVQTNAPGHEGLAEALDWSNLWMLPNTAGCQTAEEAIRVARLGREMAKLLGQEENNFIKLEVIPDLKHLLPDPIGTLEAAEKLVKEGFAVLPYINADPLLAKRLEEAGCATVMPLGSPIGSGQGIRNAANIQIIIENAQVPVVVDAGIGTPSEAAQAMEMGATALLINTAIAQAEDPVRMGQAMGLATTAGRLAYLAGRIPIKSYASPSSPLTGTIAQRA